MSYVLLTLREPSRKMCLPLKRAKYLVTEGNLTLGDEYTIQYIYDLLLNDTLETFVFVTQRHPNNF